MFELGEIGTSAKVIW